MRSARNFLSGLILGGLVGAAIALLLTPMRGEEFQQRLKTEAEQMRREVERAAQERRRDLEQQLAALRSPHTPG